MPLQLPSLTRAARSHQGCFSLPIPKTTKGLHCTAQHSPSWALLYFQGLFWTLVLLWERLLREARLRGELCRLGWLLPEESFESRPESPRLRRPAGETGPGHKMNVHELGAPSLGVSSQPGWAWSNLGRRKDVGVQPLGDFSSFFPPSAAYSYPIATLSRTMNPYTNNILEYKNAHGKIIIVYDNDERLASQAATTMCERGFENLFMLSGGRWGWESSPTPPGERERISAVCSPRGALPAAGAARTIPPALPRVSPAALRLCRRGGPSRHLGVSEAAPSRHRPSRPPARSARPSRSAALPPPAHPSTTPAAIGRAPRPQPIRGGAAGSARVARQREGRGGREVAKGGTAHARDGGHAPPGQRDGGARPRQHLSAGESGARAAAATPPRRQRARSLRSPSRAQGGGVA
uniref:Rhodanese domain-containing protein n=1 Tax=Junco hyemalis TaxID=40217 RepID=A0A8C5JSN2_JUNHY